MSKMINSLISNGTVEDYSKNVDTMPKSKIMNMFHEAEEYNAELATMVRTDDMPSFDPQEHYYDILNVTEDGIMGSVEIPAINVRLPIYHGTEKEFLDEGAGHLIGTSFPIGGQNTHAIISAHTAFPGKQFFDKLTEVKEGDIFFISVLDRNLEYKVTNTQVVLPSESQSLNIVNGKDLVTLVTCTPYGINSHRLLVTGERVQSYSFSSDNSEKSKATKDGMLTKSNDMRNPYNGSRILILIGFAVLLIVFAMFVIIAVRRKKKHADHEKKDCE